MSRPAVGFVGLGDMGGPMAASIARAGLELTVLDRRPDAVIAAVEAGARGADDVADVVRGADVVALCVVDDEQVLDLCLRAGGIVEHLGTEQLLVVHSSVRPATVHLLAEAGARVVDAPVSGARMAAEAGTLTVIAGGAAEDVARLGPYFAAIGERVHHLGPLGAGLQGKILNNVLVKGNHAVLLEVFRLAAAFGIDEAALLDVVGASSGRSWVTETFPFLDDLLFDHTAAGTEGLYHMMTKELSNALTGAREHHIGLPVSGVVLQTYRELCIDRRAELARRGRTVEP